MRFSGRRVCALIAVMGLVIEFALRAGATDVGSPNNKVIIYPTPQDSIAKLKQEGITSIRNYGSYWLVEATDSQVKALKQRHGERAVDANYLNRIELRSIILDTTTAQPTASRNVRQVTRPGKALRLVQFSGPIQPEWLTQIKAAGNVKIVSYVPNNTYIVSVDQEAEANLQALTAPAGPIQWIGAYDPYYKMSPSLSSVADTSIQVQIGVVNSPEAEQTLYAIKMYALEPPLKPSVLANQVITSIKVNPADLPSIAQLPDVLWIERSTPLERRDEAADLISADRISSLPGHSPLPGIDDYLDFLTNVVGFSTNAMDYPILDVADTLAISTVSFNDFFEFGNPTNTTRLAAFVDMCPPSAVLCDNLHGPFVMSVASGYNDSKTDPVNLDANGFRKGLGVSPYGRVSNIILYNISGAGCIFCVPNSIHPGLADIPLNEYLTGSRISNNSWGQGPVFGSGGNVGTYGGDSLSYDTTVRDAVSSGVTTNGVTTPTPFPLNQEMITVFAAGDVQNLGSGNGGFGDILVTPPATAKNVITVGASENVRNATEAAQCGLLPTDANNSFDISSFSSFGPTLDGRFKPEIVAPGTAIFGVFGVATNFFTLVGTNLVDTTGNAYICDIGATAGGPSATSEDVASSYAAPVVSGAAQLLWWYFEHRLQNEQGLNLFQPSPAMAKAYICNSARYLPITDPQTGAIDTLPSIAQGMGILDLARMFDGVPRVIRDETTPRALDTPLLTTNSTPQQTYFSRSGQSYELNGQVADPTNPFRVTLAWTDTPGNPATTKQLVNNLDLQVTIGGQTYKGNVFVGPNSATSGSVDTLNNMESVFLPAGQTGTWSVIVRAANIAGNAVANIPNSTVGQDFALVVYNAATTNRSDVPDLSLSTNNSCQTALGIDTFPFAFTNKLTKTVYHNTMPSPTAGTGGAEEFFKLLNPTPGTAFTIDTSGSSFDTVLSVWSVQVVPQAVFVRGECGFLTEVTSTNDFTNAVSQSRVTFTADGSNDYFIVVEPHNDGIDGRMVLNVGASAPPITVIPPSLSFGSQVVGTTSAPQVVTYKNGTTVSVNISDVSISGTNAADFVILSQACEGNSVISGGSCATYVAFSPTTNGLRQANLVFTDDATGSRRSVPLSGTATPAAPLLCLSSSSTLIFSSQLIGTTSAVQSVTLTNCGSTDLNISSVTLSGTVSSDFSITGCTGGGPISPGGTCTISAMFIPTAAGTRPATITVVHDAVGSPAIVSLSGTGTALAPAICFGTSVANFGNVGVGITGGVQSVTITNCGTAPLVISGTAFTGANPADFIIVTNLCNPVATGTTCQVKLQFAPTAGGSRSASLVLTNNIGSPQLLALIGSGSLSQPDAAVGKNTNLKRMVGFGNTITSTNQVISQKVSRGARKGKRYYVAVKNNGSASDRFLVQGQQIFGGSGWTVNYFLGAKPSESVDVSAAVGASTFSTSTLGPAQVTGVATMLRVEVFANKAIVPKGTTAIFTITFSSASDPGRQDTVRVAAVAK